MLKIKRIFSAILSILFLFGVLNVTPVFALDTNVVTMRLSGNDRYGTSVAISKAGWTLSGTVIIATGSDYPDALSASSLAKLYDAPILLTLKNGLCSEAVAEIQRLKATKAILVGGTGVIGTGVENQLRVIGVNFTRIGGTNRYETSKLVADKIGTSSGIIAATGLDFPDALSIAPISGIKSMPILLSPRNSLDPYIASFIKGKSIPISYLAGGLGVLSAQIASSVPNSKRLGGSDRYETNRIINNEFAESLNFNTVYLAAGSNFPDAVSGSALAAKNNSPIILTGTNSISTDTINFLKSKGVQHVVFLGGIGAISKNVENAVTNAISHPYSVSLNKARNTLAVGSTDTLTATVSPVTAINKAVTWTSSDNNIAKVDSSGKVTAVSVGTAIITAKTVDGGITASYTASVINGEIKGIDVSEWQGTINWAAVKSEGVQFAMIRSSHGDISHVNKGVDLKFETNYAAAKAAGMAVGAYHYSYAVTVDQAVTEANFFISQLNGKQFDYPVCVDIEDSSQGGLDKQMLTDIALTYLDILKQNGYYPMVYTNKYWFTNVLDDTRLTSYEHWVAQYGPSVTYIGKVGMWQYTSTGTVNGISTDVDMDASYIDYASIIKQQHLNGF